MLRGVASKYFGFFESYLERTGISLVDFRKNIKDGLYLGCEEKDSFVFGITRGLTRKLRKYRLGFLVERLQYLLDEYPSETKINLGHLVKDYHESNNQDLGKFQ